MQLTLLGVIAIVGIGVLLTIVVGLVIKSGIKETINGFMKDMKDLVGSLKK